jgi:hypothetical protein
VAEAEFLTKAKFMAELELFGQGCVWLKPVANCDIQSKIGLKWIESIWIVTKYQMFEPSKLFIF